MEIKKKILVQVDDIVKIYIIFSQILWYRR